MKPNSCYVSMPFGTKANPLTGGRIDFDQVYQGLVRPAAELAGMSALRGDELVYGAIAHKGLLEAVIACDVFVADVTLSNPNVMYELGVRHALRRGAAVIIGNQDTRLPYDISYSRYFVYHTNADGGLDEALDRPREMLSATFREASERNDSPVHELFPDIQIALPSTLVRTQRNYPQVLRDAQRTAPGDSGVSDVDRAVAEHELKIQPEMDPAAVLDILKRYRDASDWNGVVQFADRLPDGMKRLVEVQQIVALALNRRSEQGDRPRAIAMMHDLVARTGGDSETFGIIGRIYKDRYSETQDPADLQRAIDSYRAGFEKQPSDYYPAINLITLLTMSPDAEAKKELADLVPRVRELMNRRIGGDRPADFFELATALQLAVLENDWEAAFTFGEKLRAQAGAPWMLLTTIRSLTDLREYAATPPNHAKLNELIRRLTPQSSPVSR
jgi:hypothetical protein